MDCAVGPTHLFSNTLAKTTGLIPSKLISISMSWRYSVFIASAGIGMAVDVLRCDAKGSSHDRCGTETSVCHLSQGKFYLDEILYVLVVLPLRGIRIPVNAV
ncbi:MAG UNVERIFIED_CONTAM: hypothetical protein LVR18_51105 [Planctomycetaceae bacterium]